MTIDEHIRALNPVTQSEIPAADSDVAARLLDKVVREHRYQTRRSFVRPLIGAAIAAGLVALAVGVFPTGTTSPAQAGTLEELAVLAARQQPLPPGQFVHTSSEGQLPIIEWYGSQNSSYSCAGCPPDAVIRPLLWSGTDFWNPEDMQAPMAQVRASVPSGLEFTQQSWSAPSGGQAIFTVTGRTFPTAVSQIAWERAGRPDPRGTQSALWQGSDLGSDGWTSQAITQLPIDPTALTRALIAHASTVTGAGTAASATATSTSVFDAAVVLLESNSTSPMLRAALFQALAHLPHVEVVAGAHDHLGRVGLGVVLTETVGGASSSYLLVVDPRTTLIVGEVATVTAAHHSAPTLVGWISNLARHVVEGRPNLAWGRSPNGLPAPPQVLWRSPNTSLAVDGVTMSSPGAGYGGGVVDRGQQLGPMTIRTVITAHGSGPTLRVVSVTAWALDDRHPVPAAAWTSASVHARQTISCLGYLCIPAREGFRRLPATGVTLSPGSRLALAVTVEPHGTRLLVTQLQVTLVSPDGQRHVLTVTADTWEAQR